ncbi:MAG TPA: hypothetical protein VIR32_00720 [Lachnospiraceae bacterium]
MSDEIYVYYVSLPTGFKEAVMKCLDGYTIYINEKLDDSARLKAYHHALKHIKSGDFEKYSVQNIEAIAHI